MPPQAPQQPVIPQQNLINMQPAPNMPYGPQPEAPRKRFPKWLMVVGIVVVGFVVIIVIAAVVATTATKAAQKVSDQFINDVQSGNSSAAYSLTSSTFKQATSEDQLDSIIKQVGPALKGNEKVTGRAVYKSTGNPETSVLVYDVKNSDTTYYMKTELQQESGQWRVVRFNYDSKQLDTNLE